MISVLARLRASMEPDRIHPPHGNLSDVAPLADALGVLGVGGAVAPLGGGGGEGFGVDVVGAGVDG